MIGEGKYDDVCTTAREATGGSVILIVFGGKEGHGFSVQAVDPVIEHIPRILRKVADEIEKYLKTEANYGNN